MAFPNNIAQVVMNMTVPGGLPAVVVHHCRTIDNSDFDSSKCTQLAELYRDWIDTDNFQGEVNGRLLNSMVTVSDVIDVVVTGLERPAAPSGSALINLAGLGAGESLPRETAVVTTWRTGFVGRSYRGRSFWPSFRQDFTEADGTIEAGSLTGIQRQMDALIEGLTTSGLYRHGVYSRTLDEFNDTTSCIVREILHHISARNT